ncbi:MAG: hypothetical protein R3B47_03505 [Bacteroidia bacterium]
MSFLCACRGLAGARRHDPGLAGKEIALLGILTLLMAVGLSYGLIATFPY